MTNDRHRKHSRCKDKWKRIAAIAALEAFQAAYRIARNAFVSRNFDVLFPAGTWMMRGFGALCAPYPAPT